MSIIGNQIQSSNYVSDQYSGDGSTVAFTLSLAPASAASISVYVSGLYQIPGSAYTVSGTTLTFTGAPPIGTNNIYVLYLGIKNQNLVPVNGSITPQMLNNANVIFWSTSNNNVGIGNTAPGVSLDVGSRTDAIRLPVGNTSQRPAGSAGQFRFNTTNNQFEGHNGTAWGAVGGGASGGGGNPFVYENDQTVTVDYTLTSGKNGMTAGPITVASGVTVTVPSGSVWTVI